MQRSCKNAFPDIESLCFLRGLCTVVIRKSSEAGSGSQVEFRDASLPGYELGSTELSRIFGVGRIMARKELGCEKKTSCMV
jgi:hypothetical protein